MQTSLIENFHQLLILEEDEREQRKERTKMGGKYKGKRENIEVYKCT